MNYLAHIYLSGENNQIKVGNLIGDWIKGADYNKLPDDIKKGVLMHRFIDSFTDIHPVVKLSKNRLTEQYHKYSGIIIDILYDHFLARQWPVHSNVSLLDFIDDLNQCIEENQLLIPQGPRDFFPRFMKSKWIETYDTLEGIERVLHGMSKHTSLPDRTISAIEIIRNDYESFENEFNDFFPTLVREIESRFGVEVRKIIL